MKSLNILEHFSSPKFSSGMRIQPEVIQGKLVLVDSLQTW